MRTVRTSEEIYAAEVAWMGRVLVTTAAKTGDDVETVAKRLGCALKDAILWALMDPFLVPA